MRKFTRVVWKLIFLLVSLPLIKGFYDIFTAPATGLFVTAGMDSTGLAFFTAVPWLLPVIVVILLIIDLSKPDDSNNGGMGNIRF